MACSVLIDVEINQTDILPCRLIKWIQKKAPKLRLRYGKLLWFPRVITHLDFLINQVSRLSIVGRKRTGDSQSTGIVIVVDDVREIAHIDRVGLSSRVNMYFTD